MHLRLALLLSLLLAPIAARAESPPPATKPSSTAVHATCPCGARYVLPRAKLPTTPMKFKCKKCGQPILVDPTKT